MELGQADIGGWVDGWMAVGRAMLANASNLTNRRHRLLKASQFQTISQVEWSQLSRTGVYAQSGLDGSVEGSVDGSVDGSVWTLEQTTARCAS